MKNSITRILVLAMALALAALATGCGGGSDSNGISDGEIFTNTITDDQGAEIYKETFEVTRVSLDTGSGSDSALFLLPKEAVNLGVPVEGFAISAVDVAAELGALGMTPGQAEELLKEYEMDMETFMALTEGFEGSGQEIEDFFKSVYDLEISGVKNIMDFYLFMETANGTIQSFELDLEQAGYTLDSYLEKMAGYQVTFEDLMMYYIESGATSLAEFILGSVDSSAQSKASKTVGGFWISAQKLNLRPGGRFDTSKTGVGFRMLNTQDTNYIHYNANTGVEEKRTYKLRRTIRDTVKTSPDFYEITFDVFSHYGVKFMNTSIPGQYSNWSCFMNFSEKWYGGFGILEFQAVLSDPWNVGTASDPAPAVMAQVWMKTKWWNYVQYQSMRFQISGNAPHKYLDSSH